MVRINSNAGPTKRGKKRNVILALLIVSLAMILRISGVLSDTLWVDEAESALNGLTILEKGLPLGEYLGIPLYENTLTEPWEESAEYEFRDSSYSARRNVVVYHGWLPLYSIAASQALFGLKPDLEDDGPNNHPRHGKESVWVRTVAPRVPALVFSFLTCVVLFYLMRHVAGRTAALAALTWFAASGKTVWFGTQSRYYPMTLLMITVVAYLFFRTVKWGNWRSYIALGVAEGLLFHTHPLSALVFAGAALFGLPMIVRHEHWQRKCGLAASIAGALTIPWAIWAGFFETASTVPKVYAFFSGSTEWISYALERPKSLVLVLGLLLLMLVLVRFPQALPIRCKNAFSDHRFYYLFLVYWMILVYAAFHTLVPAASYFTDRLTLMLLIPFIMLVGLLVGDIARASVRQWQGLVAVVLSFGSILMLHRPAMYYGLGYDEAKRPFAKLNTYLATTDFDLDVRFYATPSNQLIYTYYFGLPVQSTAPVRKSFFDTYAGEVVILDARSYPAFIDEELVLELAEQEGLTLTKEAITESQHMLWSKMVFDDDKRAGLPGPAAAPVLSIFQESLLDAARNYADILEQEALKKVIRSPIFYEVDATGLDELWTIFFVRYSDYINRIGRNLNYYDRIQNATVTHLPQSSVVVYRSRRPVSVISDFDD